MKHAFLDATEADQAAWCWPAIDFSRVSRVISLAALIGLLAFALPADVARFGTSCANHSGAFSDAFSPDFDVSSRDCRVEGLGYFPTVRFFGVPPYVAIGR